MCIIEQFYRIYPNGFRERSERLRHCEFGTPRNPCNNIHYVNVLDERYDPALETHAPPHHQAVQPRATDRQHSPDRKKKPKKIYDDLKVVFDIHIPFTSRNKKKKAKAKEKKDQRPNENMSRLHVPEYGARPLQPGYPPPPMGYPGPGMYPMPPPPPPHHSPVGQPGGPVTPPITVYSLSSTDSSPSPLSPIREHHRPRARSLSLTRQYEERKRVIQEQEGRQHAERVAIAENAARRRAERDAERVREERDRDRRQIEALRIREQQRQIEAAAERERRRRSQEERERLAQAVVARRRREEDDRRLNEALERERRREIRRRREEEERQWMIEEERDRLERQRVARIPRAPRHVAELHHHHHHHHDRNGFERQARDNLEHHGDQVINEAIRARFGNAELRDLDGGPRRRRTIGGAERRIYDDDRRRWGPRWL
ncbi:MAG: hypothetical protein Q9170_003580 [Blastenia crenularia]